MGYKFFNDIDLPLIGTITGTELTAGVISGTIISLWLRQFILYNTPTFQESFVAAGGSIVTYLGVLHWLKLQNGKPAA